MEVQAAMRVFVLNTVRLAPHHVVVGQSPDP